MDILNVFGLEFGTNLYQGTEKNIYHDYLLR